MLFNLITITLLILLTIILIMLYFISSDSRRNKNNINICESNVLSLKDKVLALEKTINDLSNLQQPNLENMLNQLQENQNKFMNSDDLMFPLGEVDNEEEDNETDNSDVNSDDNSNEISVVEEDSDDEDDEDEDDDEDENVMLDGVNDSDEDCRELLALIKGIPSKLNLIPFNPWPGSPYKCSGPERIEAFARKVLKAGYASPVRTPRGQDIMAACGQLKSASERQRRQKTGVAG